MSDLRVGGLAILIGLNTHSEYNGRCVRLEASIGMGETYISPVTGLEYKNFRSERRWVISGDFLVNMREPGWTAVHPKHLLPIDGEDFSHEDEQQKELSHG